MDLLKNVLTAAVVLIILGVAAYFFLQPATISFEQGNAHILGLWAENGLTFANSGSAEETELAALEAGIIEFREGLAGFERNSDVLVLEELVLIHLDLVEEARAIKKLSEAREEVAGIGTGFEETCAGLDEIGEANIVTREAIEFIAVVNARIASFNAAYSFQATQSNMGNAIIETAGMQAALNEAEAALEQMKEIC